jgi:hypothetical protein
MSPRASDDPTEPFAVRLRAIRAEINSMRAAPYQFGRHGPHRRQRDELILCDFAADAWARLIEAEA